MLDEAVGALPERERVEASQQQIVLDAVDDYYLAKRFWELSRRDSLREDSRLPMLLDHMAISLMKTAVISIAAANDFQPRTKSLHGVLDLLAKRLVDPDLPDVDRDEASQAIAILQSWIHPEENEALRYVRYLRNKWAGHASFDRQFNSWGGADDFVSLVHVEEALTILVNAHELLAQLMDENQFLSDLTRQPITVREDDSSDGYPRTVPMTIKWSAVGTFASVMRLSNEQMVGMLGDLLDEALGARHGR